MSNSNTNIELLKFIHRGYADSFGDHDKATCHMAILKNWNSNPNNGMSDRLYQYDDFIDKATELMQQQTHDAFFSINSFWKARKKSCDIRHLNCFVLDYDFYSVDAYKELDPLTMYQIHIRPTLPLEPTAVIDSGRGLYVLYAFQHCSKKMMKLYRAIYKKFLVDQEQFGMDPKAMNYTQVIRIPGTYNSKSNTQVEILQFSETDYQLIDFCSILQYSYQEVKDWKTMIKISNKDNVSAKQANFKEKQREVKEMEKDLKRLILMRNKDGYVEGYREELIYLYQDRSLHADISLKKTFETAHSINEIFSKPLSPSEIEVQCKPASTNMKQNSISTIIRKLKITPEEQCKLTYLVDSREKDKRKKRLKNRHPLLNRTSREVEILYRRRKVIELKSKGYTNSKIAKAVGKDRSVITKDLKYINTHKYEFQKLLNEVYMEVMEILEDNKKMDSLSRHESLWLTEWLKWATERVFEEDG